MRAENPEELRTEAKRYRVRVAFGFDERLLTRLTNRIEELEQRAQEIEERCSG